MFKHEITILKDTFGRLLRRHAQTNLIKLINKTHPADLAIVFRYFDDDEQAQVFTLMQDNEHTIEFLIELDDTLIEKLLNVENPDRIAGLIQYASTNDQSYILSILEEEQAQFVIDLNGLLRPETITGFILLFIAVAIIAPLGEELLFRGFLQQVLEKHWKDVTKAILVTSLFFALIHMNPYWFAQIYILGVMLGFLSWKTGSVLPSLILHGLNNTMAMIFSFSEAGDGNIYIWNGHVAPWIIIIALACAVT